MVARLRSSVVAVLLLALALGWVAPALAHSGLLSSDPEADTQVGKPPTEVTLDFSETPAADSVVEIRDGCNRDVAGDNRVVEKSLVTAVDGGEPGGWSVDYTVISAEDGHETEGDFAFLVQGKQDCDPGDDGNGNGKGKGEPTAAGESETGSPDDGAAAGDEPDDSGSGAPVGLMAVGAAVLIAIAFTVRRATAPRE